MKVLRPKDLTEALEMQKQTGGYYIAGGTFSMVEIVSDRFDPETLIDLSLCKELYGITEEKEAVILGAMTTFTEIEESKLLNQYFTALVKAAAEVGGPQIRNRGTIGGNICAASPAADGITPLLVLNAVVRCVGKGGKREFPIHEMFLAPKKTILLPDEIVTEIVLPKKKNVSDFIKVGKRNALAVSSVNMAVSGKAETGRITELFIAAGACAPTPRLCLATAEALIGEVSDEAIEKAKEILLTEISPIDDRWATAEYRRMVAQNMLESLVYQIAEEEEA